MVDSPDTSEHLRRIRARKAERIADIASLEAAIIKHNQSIASLRIDLADLETAERVYFLLNGPEAGDPPSADASSDTDTGHSETDTEADTRKPPGTPSIPEMIITALSDHIINVAEPKEITRRIRERWWPEAPTQRISVVVWKMAQEQDGRLKKNGLGYYVAPKQGEHHQPT